MAIDTSTTRAFQALPCGSTDRGHEFTYFPVLTDGGPFQPGDANSICELLVNATVEPSNAFKVGKPSKVRRGKAILPVTVPGPGTLKLRGKGVKPRSAGGAVAVTSQKVKKAGKVKLAVRPKGGVSGRLARTGKAGTKVKITFSPTGGVPRTKKPKLKLKS